MLHLSIFSFDTFKPRWRLPITALLLVALLAVGEMVLRMPTVVGRLPAPEPTLWHAKNIQPKYDYMLEAERSNGIDLLFIGNSTTQAAVSPKTVDEVRNATGVGEAVSFNASVEGLPPYGVHLFLEIYLNETSPETIVYGVTAQDINSNSPWAIDVTDRVKHSPMALAKAERGVKGWFLARLLDASNLFRYRLILYQMLLGNRSVYESEPVYIDERGFVGSARKLSDVPVAGRAALGGSAGVINYSVDGIQAESVEQIVELAAANEIELILVNMPLSNDYFGHFEDSADYDLYIETIADIAHQHNVTFVDFQSNEHGPTFTDEHFADLNHLNEAGAEILSRYLVENVLQASEQ